MTGEGDACRELAAYLTGSEAKELADRLGAGHSLTMAMRAVGPARRERAQDLTRAAGLVVDNRQQAVAVLRAIEGANSHTTAIDTVWTTPGGLTQQGRLTASLHHFVDGARESVICSTYNFQRSSALWAALAGASARPEVRVRIYMDTAAADHSPAAWKPSTTEVARTMSGATVLRTVEYAGRLIRNHAKFVAVDHQVLSVTSANFSKSAENLNVELGVVIENPILTQSVERAIADFEPKLYEVIRRI